MKPIHPGAEKIVLDTHDYERERIAEESLQAAYDSLTDQVEAAIESGDIEEFTGEIIFHLLHVNEQSIRGWLENNEVSDEENR